MNETRRVELFNFIILGNKNDQYNYHMISRDPIATDTEFVRLYLNDKGVK